MITLTEVIAALQAVLDTTICDECHEDDSYQSALECTCRCHRREYEARQAARHLLTRIKAEHQERVYRAHEQGGQG